MPEVDPIKAKIIVEYDPSGVKQAKEDLQSLGEITGGLGESTGAAGEGLAALDEQLGKGAGTARSFTSAIGDLPKMMESGTSVISDMTDALSEQQGVIEAIQEPMKSYNESLQAVSDTMASPHLTENMSAFQDALENPYPFQMIGQYLNETGQTWGDFTSTIGDNNTAMLHEMANNADVTHQVLGGMSSDAQAVNKTFTESAGSAAAFTEQFNGMSEAVGKANAGINAFGGAGNILAGPLEELQSIQPIGFGEAFGNASEGLMGALNDIAMPLMAVQMIGMAVQAVGQSIYDAAAAAEGPGAHSFGSFTGTVDALGQSAAKAGEQFSEGIGQGMLPALNELNYEANQSQQSMGPLGQSLGLAVSTLASLWQIGSGSDVIGGVEGLVNVGARVIGVQQPFQGPGPAQQQQIQYEQTVANMPQTVQGQVYQMKTQSATILADSITPAYLQAQDDLSASQMIYQRVQASYNASHPVNQYQMLQQAQETAYDNQQAMNYQSQMQNPDYGPIGLNTFTDYWTPDHIADALIGPKVGPGMDMGKLFGGIGNMFSGFNMSIPLGPASMFSGISDLFSNLFGNAAGNATVSTGGCFPAGTRVLLANGDEKPIELLQVGEEVLGHDGTTQRTTTVVALITPPPRWTYELTFSDGNTLTLTASHPVSTTSGWKSLSPIATKKENPELAVTRLHIGDVVHTADGTGELIDIEALSQVQVYNITVGEPHTFYANKILVHNKMLGSTNSEVGSQVSEQIGGIQLPHIDLSGMSAQLAGSFGGIQLPHLDLSGLTAGLAGSFGGISLPHLDLSGLTAGLAGAFSGISLPSIPDFGSQISSQLGGMFSGITIPSLPDLGGMINSQLGGMFSGISLPSLPDIGGMLNGAMSGMFGGIALPSIPDIGGMLNGAMSGLFGGITIPQPPDLGGMLSGAMNGIFSGITLPSVPDLGSQISASMIGMFSGISLPSIPFFAQGVEGFGGGLAMVGEAGPELVRLPGGSSVYPLTTGSGVGGSVSPISLGGGGGSGAPQSINLTVQLDSQAILSAIGLPLSQNIRLASGMRAF